LSAPSWAVGMERIGPGVYLDKENSLHVYVPELCEALGVPYTRDNAERMEAIARAAIEEQFPNIKRGVVYDDK